ncbi:MAG TPA: hypothetical protein VH834_14350 [Solirubrobacteraceae bacterium]
MPPYPVTVTASYDAARAPRDCPARLEAWATNRDGRTFTVDDSIAPVRWTATADYLVDAPSEQDAERTAIDRFMADSSAAGIPAPETVLAATGPLA